VLVGESAVPVTEGRMGVKRDFRRLQRDGLLADFVALSALDGPRCRRRRAAATQAGDRSRSRASAPAAGVAAPEATSRVLRPGKIS
jgi:hypothetical protein